MTKIFKNLANTYLMRLPGKKNNKVKRKNQSMIPKKMLKKRSPTALMKKPKPKARRVKYKSLVRMDNHSLKRNRKNWN